MPAAVIAGNTIAAERVPALCTHNLLLAALRYPADIYQYEDEDTRYTVECGWLKMFEDGFGPQAPYLKNFQFL